MMRHMNPSDEFLSGMALGLLCALVGGLVTFVVMLYRTRFNGHNPPPEEGNPFVEPPPLAPDRIPDWVLDEQTP